MAKKLLLQFALSIAIAVGFLWLTIDHMAGDAAEHLEGGLWAAMARALGSVSAGSLVLYVLTFLVVHVARIHRWHYLITPLGETDRRKIFRICAVGFSAIVIFPLRLGEMVRPYLLSRESPHITMSAALGTAVTERVLDGLLITGLLFVSLAVWGAGEGGLGAVPPALLTAGAVSAAIFCGTTVVLIFSAARHDWTIAILRATIGRISHGLGEAVIKLVDGFLDGVRVLRGQHVMSRFLAMTAIYWGANGLGIAILANAFGFDLALWQAFGVLAILVVGIMIPAGPGFFGNFQFFLSQGLALYVTIGDPAAALAFALTINVIQFVLQVGFGIPFFLASHISMGKLIRASEAGPAGPEPTSENIAVS